MSRALLSLLFLTALPTYAATPVNTTHYTAEIILFETVGNSQNHKSHHNNTTAFKQADVLTPYYNPAAFYLSASIENRLLQLDTEMGSDDEDITSAILKTYPKPFTTWENWARSNTHAINTNQDLLLNNIAQKLSMSAKNHVLLHIGWNFNLRDDNSATFHIDSEQLNIPRYKIQPYTYIDGYIHFHKNLFFDIDSTFNFTDIEHQQYAFTASERVKEKQMYFIDKAPYGILIVVKAIPAEKTTRTA